MRYPAVDRNFFISNRNNLKAKLKPGSVAILFSNYQMPRNGDQYFPFRQQSDFFYLTGIEQERSILLLAPDSKNKELQEILFILKANKTLEIWEGRKLTRDEARNISGISTIKDAEDFDGILHSLCCESENLYFNLPELAKFLPEVHTANTIKSAQIKEKYPLHRFERLAPLLTELRLKKSETEIDLMRKAASITRKAFLNVLSSIKPGMKEYEIEAIVTHEFICSGAQGHAYAPIIASGRNACVLHYVENNCICAEGDLLLMDIGAEYANYAADLSRTIPVSGKFSKRQLELYTATLRVLRAAMQLMKPGITINELHDKVCKYWEEEHIRLGLYTAEDVKRHKEKEPLSFGYYMHGTSHFLGIDVHDAGTKDIRLEPGMVLTCEPGIYIADEGVGIRLENNILITENGNIDLMEDIPIETDEIVQLMKR